MVDYVNSTIPADIGPPPPPQPKNLSINQITGKNYSGMLHPELKEVNEFVCFPECGRIGKGASCLEGKRRGEFSKRH